MNAAEADDENETDAAERAFGPAVAEDVAKEDEGDAEQ
jgi:hypothetical protein